MKIFTKPDEMEMALSYKAMRATWILVNTTFIIVAVVVLLTENYANFVSLYFLVGAEIVYYVIKACLKFKMVKGGREK